MEDSSYYSRRAEEASYDSRRHSNDAESAARNSKTSADDARRYAATAKDSVLIVQKLASSVEEALKQIEGKINEVKGLKNEQIKQLRSELKASELRELKYLKLIRELERKLSSLAVTVNDTELKSDSSYETQTKNQSWSGPTVEKLDSVNRLKPRSRVS